jgi:hypothetical protein
MPASKRERLAVHRVLPRFRPVVRWMYREHRRLNTLLFDGVLGEPIIVVGEIGLRAAMGSTGPAYDVRGHNGAIEIRLVPSLFTGRHPVQIKGTTLRRRYALGVLIHEMCHQRLQDVGGIGDADARLRTDDGTPRWPVPSFGHHGGWYAAVADRVADRLDIPFVHPNLPPEKFQWLLPLWPMDHSWRHLAAEGEALPICYQCDDRQRGRVDLLAEPCRTRDEVVHILNGLDRLGIPATIERRRSDDANRRVWTVLVACDDSERAFDAVEDIR